MNNEPPTTDILARYAEHAGQDAIDQLHQLAKSLQGLRVVHVNSTRRGGGVAEILETLVPLMRALGLDASWEVIEGNDDFFATTKSFHNALQGKPIHISEPALRAYEEVNTANAERLRPVLEDADVVFIHDPQPVPLLACCSDRRGKWIWRCHIDLSHPFRPVWRYLRQFVTGYDASIFSLDAFAPPLMPHPVFLIPPSIDPLSKKNQPLPRRTVNQTLAGFGIDPERPIVMQISRFDRFKDPIGVIQAYKLATDFVPSLQLVLAGGSADDDPEGQEVIREVREAAAEDPDIHVLADSHYSDRTINALQSGADIVLQKSIREGFGLTVTEARWKAKPVIGGNTGGIRLQIIDRQTGFLVDSPEGAALRIRHLLSERKRMTQIGRAAKELVRHNFLSTRHVREYLTLTVALLFGGDDRIELN